ncbi:MAG: DUF2500 domain-containing protein [Firmicutes bacterium]|nr:DUF2500 domain-containing protein [Bacillota bacterium]
MGSAVPVIAVIIFVLVIGVIIAAVIKSGVQWNKNNNSPVLTVDAKIAAKRSAVSESSRHAGSDMSVYNTSTFTTYYATFEVESGDRMELRVPGSEYGLLAEGDTGRLTFQGTRYKGFERNRQEGNT